MKKFIIRLLGLDKQIEALKEDIRSLTRECAILTRDLNDQRFKTKELDNHQGRILNILKINGETVLQHKHAIEKIISMIHIGVDVHSPTFDRNPSWCVVCLKGKENDRDIVNFFEVRFEDYRRLKDLLKQFDIFEKKALDLPPHLPKSFFR